MGLLRNNTLCPNFKSKSPCKLGVCVYYLYNGVCYVYKACDNVDESVAKIELCDLCW